MAKICESCHSDITYNPRTGRWEDETFVDYCPDSPATIAINLTHKPLRENSGVGESDFPNSMIWTNWVKKMQMQ